MSATPDVRAIMDNQFKNVKSHARLLSKAMWYEWRMKLLEGLKEGLLRIGNGFDRDADLLRQQGRLLQSVVPGLLSKHGQLESEAKLLQAHADELNNCDKEELAEARERLVEVESDIETKKRILEELQAQLREREEEIELVTERKQDCLAEIEEAERVREECRGWNIADVAVLKGNRCLMPK
jgi:kinetochore protein Spc7/SPC105